VRFGLRAPDDIHVRDSLAVIDALLRVETDSGPAWRRYNGDGYGEHEDGQGFDGTGQGRPWPLLTGERGHYELIAGNDARPFLRAMSNMAGRNGMLPEQVWDGPAMPDKQLVSGKPTGSAMPLAWTHAEFVKLMLSIQLGRACDCPQSVLDRYRGGMPQRRRAVWSEHGPVADFPVGSDLRINVSSPGLIRWRTSVDEQWRDTPVQVSLPDVYSAVLRTGGLANGDRVEFAVMAEAGAAPGATHSLIAESGLSR
jgi:glucoamylase